MPLSDGNDERRSFFANPALDEDLSAANEAFWLALMGHIERDGPGRPRAVLDIGCHTGGLLLALDRRFHPDELLGIEPIAAARAAASQLLEDARAARVEILDVAEWDRVPSGRVDLVVSHETLYLEPDVPGFMERLRRVLASRGVAYVVLGCHAENPLWQTWKASMIEAGHRVYDHEPVEIMEAAARADLLPSVQPLRRSGWVTYDPLRADYHYPSVVAMLEHHYRHKLIFRLTPRDDATSTP